MHSRRTFLGAALAAAFAPVKAVQTLAPVPVAPVFKYTITNNTYRIVFDQPQDFTRGALRKLFGFSSHHPDQVFTRGGLGLSEDI